MIKNIPLAFPELNSIQLRLLKQIIEEEVVGEDWGEDDGVLREKGDGYEIDVTGGYNYAKAEQRTKLNQLFDKENV